MLCCCLRPSQAQRYRLKAMKYVMNEVSISRILKQLRILEAQAKKGMTDEEWGRVVSEHAHMAYSDFDDSDEPAEGLELGAGSKRKKSESSGLFS